MIDRAEESALMPTAASPLPAGRRVLVLAPHADDEVFGCGGSLHLLAQAGASITVIVASDGVLGGKADDAAAGGAAHETQGASLIAQREAESRAAAETLGYPAPAFWRLPDRGLRYGEALVTRMLEAMQETDADLVFAPALTELHPDHQALALASAEALRRLGGERSIAFYEVSAPLLPNTLIDITGAEDVKLAAMRCFRSQLAQQPYDDHIAALNRYRSYTLGDGVRAAEAFFMATAGDLAIGLTPLFESALGRRRRLGVATEGVEVPLVSVIVRSMDRLTLAEALTSLAAQTYPNIEVLVINATGKQHSPLPDFGGRLIMRLVESGAPLTRSRAANAGLDAARGQYAAFLDDDDTLDPDHLSQLVATLRSEGDGAVVYSGVRCMARNDPAHKITRVFGEPFESRAKLLAGNFIPSHAPLFPRRFAENGARFDETLDVYEDWDFWLQLAQTARFVYVDRVSATYFTGGTSDVSPLAFDPEAVRRAARTLFSKWKDHISPDEIKALGDLYHQSQAEVAGIKAALQDREADIRQLEYQIDGYDSELRRKEREVKAYLQQLAAAETSLSHVLASRSWRLTQPVRTASAIVRSAAHRTAGTAYRLYTFLPISVRIHLRPLLRPLTRYLRARHAPAAGMRNRLPVDYMQAVVAAEGAAPASLEFPYSAAPTVSIVVVDEGGRDQTWRTLAALRQEHGVEDCEVIVVAADPSAWLAQPKGPRLERRSGGLLEGYAHGAALARAPWLLFWSGNSYPLPGMLAELRRLIAEQPGTALVVPKLVSEHAQLIFPVDRAGVLDPNLPEVNFVCPADRCPAAAFLVNKSFLGSGEALRSADAGLMTALVGAIQTQGGRILYAPYMHAIVPAGTLPADSARWCPDNAAGRRVLILDLHTPTPDMDSGSVDAYFQMKILGELGYRVTFAPVTELVYRSRYTADLQRIGVECLYAPYTASVVDHLREQGRRYDFVMLNRLAAAEEFIDYVQYECRGARIVFNTVDLHFLREQRRGELTGQRAMARQARDTRRRELRVMQKAAATLVISEAEAALLRQEAPEVRTFHLPLIMHIPDRADTPFGERKDLFFIGGYRHLPNVDAVLHFVADVWPRVRTRLPGVRFHIIGSDPPPEILALAGSDIVVEGFVPDAAPFFNGCRLSVAPLRYGAGLKGKVGRSLGYGCPVVLTPLAAEGMNLTDGRDALIAESGERFADAVVRLYENESLWNTLAREGLQFFDAHFSLEVGKTTLAAIFEALDARH
ncbi:MAG: PIG-L family deacetylase [Betaproteobacteria bacterium]|nr:PIG-L family deacetylase [Betaproteobacteria bacterium]